MLLVGLVFFWGVGVRGIGARFLAEGQWKVSGLA